MWGLHRHLGSSLPPGFSRRLYVHSAVANWKKCLHSIKLKDSVLSLVYVYASLGRCWVGWGATDLVLTCNLLGT